MAHWWTPPCCTDYLGRHWSGHAGGGNKQEHQNRIDKMDWNTNKKTQRAGKYREKVWRSLAVLCANIFQTCLCTRKPPLTLPPPSTHLSGSINVLFPPPVGSCSSLYHPTPSSLPVFRRVAALISLLKQCIYCEEQCDSLSSEQVCELS